MDQSTDPTASVGRTLEQEMNLVRDAIAMVASGAAPRVIVGGLRFGEALLSSSQHLATEAGVRLVPIWVPDDAGADIAVERFDHD